MEIQPSTDTSKKKSIDQHLSLTECNYQRYMLYELMLTEADPNPQRHPHMIHVTIQKKRKIICKLMKKRVRKKKEKVPKHYKKGVNEKEMDSFTKRVLRIPVEKPFEKSYLSTNCGCSSERQKIQSRTLRECSIRSKQDEEEYYLEEAR